MCQLAPARTQNPVRPGELGARSQCSPQPLCELLSWLMLRLQNVPRTSRVLRVALNRPSGSQDLVMRLFCGKHAHLGYQVPCNYRGGALLPGCWLGIGGCPWNLGVLPIGVLLMVGNWPDGRWLGGRPSQGLACLHVSPGNRPSSHTNSLAVCLAPLAGSPGFFCGQLCAWDP